MCFFYLRVLLTFGRLTLDVGTALLLFACCFDLGQGWKLRLRGYCISQLSCSFVHLENSRSSIWAGPWGLRCSITSAVYWKNKKNISCLISLSIFKNSKCEEDSSISVEKKGSTVLLAKAFLCNSTSPPPTQKKIFHEFKLESLEKSRWHDLNERKIVLAPTFLGLFTRPAKFGVLMMKKKVLAKSPC